MNSPYQIWLSILWRYLSQASDTFNMMIHNHAPFEQIFLSFLSFLSWSLLQRFGGNNDNDSQSTTFCTTMLVSFLFLIHSFHGFTENGPSRDIAQLWKLFSYITIRILKISFRNSVSSLISKHYFKGLFTGSFNLTLAQSF